MGRSQFEELLRQDERNASLFVQEEKESDTPELPELTTEPETIYPAEQNELPYDIVVERLRVNEAERPEPETVAANFRITDEHLGEGGPKQKFRANIMAIQLLKNVRKKTARLRRMSRKSFPGMSAGAALQMLLMSTKVTGQRNTWS